MIAKDIFEEIKKFVEQESLNNDKGWHKEWMIHLESVASNSMELADKFGADKEVVFLASWLHDIGTIVTGKKENHHIIGTEIAKRKLREMGYPEDKISKVKRCIFSHRASQNIKRETIEAQILADADSMAHFENIEDLVKADLVLGGTVNKDEANKNIKAKLIRDWERLSPEGKIFAKGKYTNINLILT